jgi:methionyl-tRNA formyltransferase
MTRAVVFAYHQVGVRCLEVLLAQGIEVALVLSHEDDPDEVQWYPSLVERAKRYGLKVVTPDSPNTTEWKELIQSLQPDFIFSFYYRHLIDASILALASKGAFNMHGSLLPRYRGRVPINWAIVNGEIETGATLHLMTAKADEGDCIDQMSVPILPNDTAFEVFQKVCVAAECVLHRSLPALLSGTAQRSPQEASQASYFGRRRPEDGCIDWSKNALSIHNLIRAVAPPYPGAFFHWQGAVMRVEASLLQRDDQVPMSVKEIALPGALCLDDKWWAKAGDGNYLRLWGVSPKTLAS